MKIKYDEKILMKIPAKIKEDAEEKARTNGKTLSSYIRDLIVKDLKEK